MKPTRYWRLLFIYLFIYLFLHDLGTRRKLPKQRQLLAIFVKLNFSVHWYLFTPQNLPSATYLTDNPFFTDHTFFRLFSRMSTKPLLSFNNYPISPAYWSRAVIDAQLLPLIYLRTDISLTTQKNCFLCFVQNDTQFWKVCTFYEIIFD